MILKVTATNGISNQIPKNNVQQKGDLNHHNKCLKDATFSAILKKLIK